MNNDEARKRVRLIKAVQNIKYKEIAEYIEVKQSSFNDWLSGWYDFSEKRLKQLYDVLNTLEEQ